MLEAIFFVLFGFFFLALGADRLVTGASAVAREFGISPLIIGLTIIALGTSAPEIIVTIMAALKGNPGLGVGNAIGSNIANIGLVIGVTAVVAPLEVRSQTLRREYPVLLMTMVLLGLLMFDGYLGWIDGVMLLLGLAALFIWLLYIGMHPQQREPLTQDYRDEMPEKMTLTKAVWWFFLGLAFLLSGSHVMVKGAVTIAHALGVSDLVIGLTIVAIGTSLPEIATSVAAAIKGESDMAIGNILGSNLFNILAVIPFAGLIHPAPVAIHLLIRDLPIMLAVTIALFVMSMSFRGLGRISRTEGGILLLSYVAYLTLIYFDL